MPNIHQALLIAAPAETVYRAITTQEGLAGWWTPDAKAKPDLNSVARFPFGPNYYKEMQIAELTPAKAVRWTCIHGADEWVGTTLSFALESGDHEELKASHPEQCGQLQQAENTLQTMLTFSHDGWKSYSPMFAECSYTWGRFLRSLKLYCETGKGRPWPNQHR